MNSLFFILSGGTLIRFIPSFGRGNLHLDNRSFILHPFKFSRSGYLLHHIKLTCLLAGFFERIHENRKKYTKSESKPNCYHHSNCRTETNKPRPNAVLIVRRDFIAADSHGSEFYFVLCQTSTVRKKPFDAHDTSSPIAQCAILTHLSHLPRETNCCLAT